MTLSRQAPHLGKGGRPIRVPRSVTSVRALLRRHLAEENLRMQDLAAAWEVKPKTVYDVFCDDRPLSPSHIKAAAKFLGLDEFDTSELMLTGARESGFEIDPAYLLEATP